MYTVRWKRSALDELARIWISADSPMREAITVAAHAIEQRLITDQFRDSESREHGMRVLFVFPLGVRFEVDTEHAIVRVFHLWSYRKRNRT